MTGRIDEQTGDQSIEATEDASIQARCMAALVVSDEQSRAERADRMAWVALHRPHTQAFYGRLETVELMKEAHAVFVGGHPIAALLTAMAAIEHMLVDELERRGLKSWRGFKGALDSAREHKLFPADWLDRADRLRGRRNPLAHIKSGEHLHGLGARVRIREGHPRDLLEADARDSIELMYCFFVATIGFMPDPTERA